MDLPFETSICSPPHQLRIDHILSKMTLVVRVKALNTAFYMQLIAPAHARYDEKIRMCDNVDSYPLQPVLKHCSQC